MSNRTILPLIITAIASIIALTANGAPKKKKKKKAPPPINYDAKNLSKAIPLFDHKNTKADAEAHMIKLMQILAETNRDSVSSNQSLLEKALDFRPDIGTHQKTTTVGAILNIWSTAFDYGAISEGHHYTGRINSGRYEGEQLVFENIVPAKSLPGCQGYIGNLRLVPESLARKPNTPIDRRDEAYAIGLKQVMHESKTHAALILPLGMSEEEYAARWRKEVIETGAAYRQPPNLQIVGQRTGSPSAMNDFRHILRVEITNMSRHPTEVVIESTIVGYTDNGNRIYEMKKDRRSFKLRRSEVREYKIKTPHVKVFSEPLKRFDPQKSQKVIYRGYTIVAKFNGKVIGSTGSDGRMMRVASGEYPAPAVINKVTRAGSMSASASSQGYDLVKFSIPADLLAGRNGTTVSRGISDTIAVMADEKRLYRLDSFGTLWVYVARSFDSTFDTMGVLFAGGDVHSLFCDGKSFYVHLSQPAGDYQENDVVKFASVTEMISGQNGEVIGKAAGGAISYMADGKSFYKIYKGNVYNLLFSGQKIEQLITNARDNFKQEGKLFCDPQNLRSFSDGVDYYLHMPSKLNR